MKTRRDLGPEAEAELGTKIREERTESELRLRSVLAVGGAGNGENPVLRDRLFAAVLARVFEMGTMMGSG
uniref:Uncharacterized protein n=1 Tax=Cannabis sativa TaxID=3483 RepID=A0A803NJT5_CANSA